jgi:hypothetical protein
MRFTRKYIRPKKPTSYRFGPMSIAGGSRVLVVVSKGVVRDFPNRCLLTLLRHPDGWLYRTQVSWPRS